MKCKGRKKAAFAKEWWIWINIIPLVNLPRMAHVTIRTIRYYDKKGLLKPSFINESGYRMYSDEDFLKLQNFIAEISRIFLE